MKIEKPTGPITPGMALLVLLVGAPIIALPFLVSAHQPRQLSSAPSKNQNKAPAGGELSKEESRAEKVSSSVAEQPQSTAPPSVKIASIAEPIDLAGKPGMPPSELALPEKTLPEETVTPPLPGTPLQGKPAPIAAEEKTPVVLTSYYGDVKIIGLNGESQAVKGRQILEGETIEVGASGQAVLEIAELYVLSMKPNTKLKEMPPTQDEPFTGQKRVTHRFKLEEGALLGTTKERGNKNDMLSLFVKDKKINIQDSTFRIQMNDAAPWIGVLRGSVRAQTENGNEKPVVIHSLEKIPLAEEALPVTAPVKVSKEEWGLLRETYDMNQKTARQEAAQIDLSKRAGDFFGYVFDHGTFYTENVGYTVRDFYEDKLAGGVYLEAEYDVFPSNSYVGLYVLTRDLDARDYGGIRFDVRRKPDEGYPDRFYLEIKSKSQIIHRFEITDIKPEWSSRQIDFFMPASTPITEVTIVFLNQTIGQSKKGYIQMRNIEMIPLSADQKVQRKEAEKTSQALALKSKPERSPPASSKQATLTLPVKKARTVAIKDKQSESVPFKTDDSHQMAGEVVKVVSLEDLEQ